MIQFYNNFFENPRNSQKYYKMLIMNINIPLLNSIKNLTLKEKMVEYKICI